MGQINSVIKKTTYDAPINSLNPTFNYGVSPSCNIGIIVTGTPKQYTMHTRLEMPPQPTGTGAIRYIRYYFYVLAFNDDPFKQYRLRYSDHIWTEGTGNGSATADGATWNTYNGISNWASPGGDASGEIFGTGHINGTGWFYIEIPLAEGWTWNDEKYCLFQKSEILSNKYIQIGTSEDAAAWRQPYIEVGYDDLAPTAITDLEVYPNPAELTEPMLTWTPNRDNDFVQYKIFKSTSPAMSGATLLATITNQGQNNYVDTGTVTEGTPYYYGIAIEDAVNVVTSNVWGASDDYSTHSNVTGGPGSVKGTSCVRPAISAVTPSTITPTVGQEITVTITASGAITRYYHQWGLSTDNDPSWGWSTEAARKHRYPYQGTQNIKGRVEIDLGFYSDIHDIPTTTVTVAGIDPTINFAVRPRTVVTGSPFTLNGIQSEWYVANAAHHYYLFHLAPLRAFFHRTPTYTDETGDCWNAVATDVTLGGSVAGDNLLLCLERPTNLFWLQVRTPPNGGSVSYQYWSTTGWKTFTGLLAGQGNLSLSVLGTHIIKATMPTDAAISTINGQAGYWVKIQTAGSSNDAILDYAMLGVYSEEPAIEIVNGYPIAYEATAPCRLALLDDLGNGSWTTYKAAGPGLVSEVTVDLDSVLVDRYDALSDPEDIKHAVLDTFKDGGSLITAKMLPRLITLRGDNAHSISSGSLPDDIVTLRDIKNGRKVATFNLDGTVRRGSIVRLKSDRKGGEVMNFYWIAVLFMEDGAY